MQDEKESSLKIISKSFGDTEGANGNGFAYKEIMGKRSAQEDTIVWEPYNPHVLQNLSLQEIGQRLWTTYQILNKNFSKTGGTTASTTIINKQHLITATLADTVSFAVIYNITGEVAGVHRLNSKIYTPNTEIERIKQAGGRLINNRIDENFGCGMLAVSRAIGDAHYRGVCADALIDITSFENIPSQYKIQLITACDGFTESLLYGSKKTQAPADQEDYLVGFLNKMNCGKPGQLSEAEIAQQLVNYAYEDDSQDNISVSVQTIRQPNSDDSFIGMTGVYDGHGGTAASHYTADNIGLTLRNLLALSNETYDKEKYSVHNCHNIYYRDNNNQIHQLSLNIQLKEYYAYYTEDRIKNRLHLFPSKKAFSNLTGDRLKSQILQDIHKKIDNCENEEALKTVIDDFKKTDNYTIVRTSQGFSSWFFSTKTTALWAFECMCSDKMNELLEKKKNSSSPSS